MQQRLTKYNGRSGSSGSGSGVKDGGVVIFWLDMNGRYSLFFVRHVPAAAEITDPKTSESIADDGFL